MTSEYLITVITGIRKGAGTDASVSLIIKGNSSKTYRLDYHCCSANGPAILTWAGARTRFDSGGIKKECKRPMQGRDPQGNLNSITAYEG